MVTVVDAVTTLVLTVKVAVVAPGGTATLEGMLAGPLLLEAQLAHHLWVLARLASTVPVEDCTPPITLVGSASARRVWGWRRRRRHRERG